MNTFSPTSLARIELEKTKYPDPHSALLPALWWAQEEGFIFDTPTMDYIAQVVGVSPIRVYEAVTFYTMYNRKPVGKYHLQVCHNISCSMLGAEHIIDYLLRKLHVGIGEVTADGCFAVSRVECLASCGTAPMLQMNDRFYENLTEPRLDWLLDQLRSGNIPDLWPDGLK